MACHASLITWVQSPGTEFDPWNTGKARRREVDLWSACMRTVAHARMYLCACMYIPIHLSLLHTEIIKIKTSLYIYIYQIYCISCHIYHMIYNIFDIYMIYIIYLRHCIPGYDRAWCVVKASLKSWSPCLSLLHVKVIGTHNYAGQCVNSSRQQFFPLLCLPSLLQLEYGYDDPCYDRVRLCHRNPTLRACRT